MSNEIAAISTARTTNGWAPARQTYGSSTMAARGSHSPGGQGCTASPLYRAARRVKTPMRRGHGTSRSCGTPLECLRGAAPGRCPAPERPGSHPAAAPPTVAAMGNITPQISQRRPWTLQHLDALDPHLTPTALESQTFCRSRQQRVHSRDRTPQHPCCMDTPALQQR